MAKPTALVEFDGACQENPGPAGYGFIIETQDETFTGSDHIGNGTNNEAEYHALIAGLNEAGALGFERLHVRGDSELIIRQITGVYDVRAENLRPLHEQAMELIERFDDVDVEWVPREENSLANEVAQKHV